MTCETAIRDELVRRGEALLSGPRVEVQFTSPAEANALVNDLEGHPHAFVIACLMDRTVRTERAWHIPFAVATRIGDSSFGAFEQLTEDQIRGILQEDGLHRHPAPMAQTFRMALDRIGSVYAGDASSIWAGTPSSTRLVLNFLEFSGAGPKIASMAANILVRDMKVPVSDRIAIDISADSHVQRVFGRLGITRENPIEYEVILRARELNLPYPGVFDLPVWEIGRRWCRVGTPLCGPCTMNHLCPTGRERLQRD